MSDVRVVRAVFANARFLGFVGTRHGCRWMMLAGVLWLGLGRLANAANWYVDSAANGANNGTSWANAWRSFGSVVWGTIGVKAGDTLYISGGSPSKIYNETWSVGASGTANAPIRIAIDATDPNHNGLAIFDYDAQGDTCTTTYAISLSRNYITVDGNVGGEAHLVIRNLRNHFNRYVGYGLRGSGNGITVRHVAITNCNNGIILSGSGLVVNHCNLAQIRGDAGICLSTSGGWDANLIYSNFVGCLVNMAVPPGGSGVYVGPDPIQAASGVSIFGNRLLETKTSEVYTSTQHPDVVQCTGNYVKFHNNEVMNIGDAGFDYDCYSNPNPHDIWIYNNVFRIVQPIDSYPEFFRFYTSQGAIQSFSNFKILNNTFVDSDGDYYVILFNSFNGNPTASGIEIKNNVFFGCGGANIGGAIINIDNSTAFTSDSFSFDGNIYYHPNGPRYIKFRGTTQTTATWVAANEPRGKTEKPTFVSYARHGGNNNFRLHSSDTVARDAGLNVSAFFGGDFDGVSRPQGAAWDIGAFEYTAGEANTNPIIVVSPDSLSFGSVPVGASSNLSFTVRNLGAGTLAGRATVAAPFQIIAGETYNLTSNASQTVTVRYAPTTAGNHRQTVFFSGGGSASSTVSGSGWPSLPGLFFPASAGTIASPFITDAGGNVWQAAQTGVLDGGQAVYGFALTNAGSYLVAVNVNAPTDAANSLFVNIDAEPRDPHMIWDIPVTSGFEQRLVSWRGNGTFDNNEFNPRIFNLSAGTHQLIIRGREANVQMQNLTILPALRLTINQSSSSGLILSWPSETGRVYQLQSSTNLTHWSDVGVLQEGTGQALSYPLPLGAGAQVFRVRID